MLIEHDKDEESYWVCFSPLLTLSAVKKNAVLFHIFLAFNASTISPTALSTHHALAAYACRLGSSIKENLSIAAFGT